MSNIQKKSIAVRKLHLNNGPQLSIIVKFLKNLMVDKDSDSKGWPDLPIHSMKCPIHYFGIVQL